jgi:tRNA threonylcarbamoyladenosine biosynthesis protein TsaB
VRILALETTEAIGTVAAMDDGKLLSELMLEPSLRSAQALAPGMKALLRQVGWRAADVDLVAVTVGPGSFTGLRVGVTAAKTFAYAAQAEVLGLDTLEVIAAGAPEYVDMLSAAVDAQRGDVVAGLFRRGTDGWLHPATPTQLTPIDSWLSGLPAGTWLSGPVLKKLAGRVPATLRSVEPQFWAPRASTVARVAARYHEAGRRDDVWSLLPHYCRRSAAEEKWEQREQG